MPLKNFDGRRVLSLESRRSTELARLIENYRGVALSAPAIREIPIEGNEEVLQLSRDLIEGCIDMVVFRTGVGARALLKVIGESNLARIFSALCAPSRSLHVAPSLCQFCANGTFR
jgi:uroporphyrinogen-III synthase